MPTKTGNPTRAEKREENKAAWREYTTKARTLTKLEKEDIIKEIRNDDTLTWQEKFLEAAKMCLNMVECANAAKKGLGDVYKEKDENEDFNKEHARAREIANEKKAEFTEAMNEEEPRAIYDAQGNKIYDKTELMWRKAREDNIKWLLSVRDPARFGNNQKIDTNITGSTTTKIIRDDI